ncbi:MAG: LysE family transporter [Planctomycetota bacterium]|nr:MAG: LysE family transporter [Planctomycetota bacterium]
MNKLLNAGELMNLPLFLIQVLIISLSGAMAPGPVTTAAIAMGARSRYAGAFIALGHAIIEFPVMLLIILGMAKILQSPKTQIAIGLAGGTFLLLMAIQMITTLNAAKTQQDKTGKQKPILTGIILSAGNPYFLIWWATVGLTLATTAGNLGIWAFALFVIFHWLTDLIWLQALSWASFKGTKLLGQKSQQILLIACSIALLLFGLFFIYNSGSNWIKLSSPD